MQDTGYCIFIQYKISTKSVKVKLSAWARWCLLVLQSEVSTISLECNLGFDYSFWRTREFKLSLIKPSIDWHKVFVGLSSKQKWAQNFKKSENFDFFLIAPFFSPHILINTFCIWSYISLAHDWNRPDFFTKYPKKNLCFGGNSDERSKYSSRDKVYTSNFWKEAIMLEKWNFEWQNYSWLKTCQNDNNKNNGK